MAEYSQTGILTALLLFTVVTLRDIYVGRSLTQHQARESLDVPGSDILRGADPQKQAKHALYTGPVLKFQYCIS